MPGASGSRPRTPRAENERVGPGDPLRREHARRGAAHRMLPNPSKISFHCAEAFPTAHRSSRMCISFIHAHVPSPAPRSADLVHVPNHNAAQALLLQLLQSSVTQFCSRVRAPTRSRLHAEDPGRTCPTPGPRPRPGTPCAKNGRVRPGHPFRRKHMCARRCPHASVPLLLSDLTPPDPVTIRRLLCQRDFSFPILPSHISLTFL